MDRKPITAMALIDLRKAFDSLCHLSLLNKLTKEPITWLTRLGTLNKALVWLLSYLTNRQQCMGIATSLSEPLTLTHRVPQGSILGFQKSSSHVTVNPMWMTRKYLSFSTKDLDSYSYLRLVAEDLYHVSEWCCANHLLVNPDKTKLLLFWKETNPAQNALSLNEHVRHFTPLFYQPVATQRGFDYKALKTWNNFPVATRNSRSISQFNKSVKREMEFSWI